MNRKDFIFGSLGLTLTPTLSKVLAKEKNQDDNRLTDEDFWRSIRNQFALDDKYLDFRANAASPIPKASIKRVQADYRFSQSFPSQRNSEMNERAMHRLRTKLAKQVNCSPDEIAVMRNTTEALNNAIMGIPLGKGDEVIAATHEYDSMMGSLYQRKIKDGIVIKQIEIPYTVSSSEEVLELWKKAITPKTKALLISHIVWISGQIYPVKEICELARKNGILTIVDAAQSFSHIPVDIDDLGCDYLGASLHKWCAAPLGTGFLYIKRGLIARTFPLLAHYVYAPDEDNIAKFENFGSISPVFCGAVESLDFWEKLSFKLKTNRMQHLKKYWTEKLKKNSKIEIVTNTDEKYSCGLAFFNIKGKSSTEVSDRLWKEHQIKVAVIENYRNRYVDYGDVNVIGIAAPVFVTIKELDRFVRAIDKIV